MEEKNTTNNFNNRIEMKKGATLISHNKKRVSLLSILVCIAVIASPLSTLNLAGFGLLVYVFVPLLMVFIVTAFRFSSKLRCPIPLTFLILFFSYCLLGFVWSPSPNVENFIQVFLLILCISLYKYNDYEQVFIKISTVLALLVICYLVHISAIGIQSDGRASITIFNVERDPNYVSLILLPGVAVLSKILFEDNKLVLKIISIGLILLTLFTTLRMGTRGGVFSSILVLILSFLCYRKISFGKIAVALAVVALIYALFPIVLSTMPDWVADRFTKSAIENDSYGGRAYIWKQVISVWSNNQSFFITLFGFGTNSSMFVLGRATHNFVLQYLIEGGIIAVVLLFVFIFSFSKRAIITKNYLPFVIFTSSFFMALSLSIAGIVDFWMNIALSFALFSSNKVEIEY